MDEEKRRWSKHLDMVSLTENQKHPSRYEVRAGMGVRTEKGKSSVPFQEISVVGRRERSEDVFQRGSRKKHARVPCGGQGAGGGQEGGEVRERMTEPMVSGAWVDVCICENSTVEVGGRVSE